MELVGLRAVDAQRTRGNQTTVHIVVIRTMDMVVSRKLGFKIQTMKIRQLQLLAIAASTLTQIAISQSAFAQSAMPSGYWTTAHGEETLLISNSGCKLDAAARGRMATVSVGSCSWRPSSRGGILTIMSTMTYRPAPVYFNVVWINKSQISVEGDIFYRRQ